MELLRSLPCTFFCSPEFPRQPSSRPPGRALVLRIVSTRWGVCVNAGCWGFYVALRTLPRHTVSSCPLTRHIPSSKPGHLGPRVSQVKRAASYLFHLLYRNVLILGTRLKNILIIYKYGVGCPSLSSQFSFFSTV